MNKEIKIVAGVGLAAGTVAGAYYINELKNKRSKNNMFNKKDIEKTLVELGEDVREDNGVAAEILNSVTPERTKSSLSPIEKEKISSMVNGMSEEEMKITLQNIPMDLIFYHIAGVLERNRQFAQSIQDAMNRLQE